MTEAKRKRYTREFKQDAVILAACERYTIAAPARRLGVNENMSERWRRGIKTDDAQTFRGHGMRAVEAEDLHRLREENRRLRLERDILKKAAAFLQA